MSSQNARAHLIAFGLIKDARRELLVLEIWEGGLLQKISAGGLLNAECLPRCMLGGKAAGTESTCSGLCLMDLVWPESWPSLSQYGKLSHRKILWCEVWAHADMPIGIMNRSIWWKAEASLRTICAFSIVLTTKLKAFCVSEANGALLNSKAISKVSSLKLRS